MPPPLTALRGLMSDTDTLLNTIATILFIFTSLCLLQILLWRSTHFLSWLHYSRIGHWLRALTPWKQTFRENFRQRVYRNYGRAVARFPYAALAGGVVFAVTLLGGCVQAWLHLEATPDSYSPWTYLDPRSDVSQAMQRSRATFGPPPSTLVALASPCDGRSVLGSGTLKPLVRLHNGLVSAGGDVVSYADVCARVGTAKAASGLLRCSFDSILALANPAAVDETARVDESSHRWVPPLLPGDPWPLSQEQIARSPYEPLVHALLRDVHNSRSSLLPGVPTSPGDASSHGDASSPGDATSGLAAEGGGGAEAFTPGSQLFKWWGEAARRVRDGSAAEKEASIRDAPSLSSAALVTMGSPLGAAAADLLTGLRAPTPTHGAPPFAAGAIARYRYHEDGNDAPAYGRLWMSAGGQLLIGPEAARVQASATERIAQVMPTQLARVLRRGTKAAARWEDEALAMLERHARDVLAQRRRATRAMQDAWSTVRSPRAQLLSAIADGTSDEISINEIAAAANPFDTLAAAGALGPECFDVAWDSNAARARDMLWMRLQLLCGLLLWLPLLHAATMLALGAVAPLLRRPILHASVVLGCAALASVGGISAIGWAASLEAAPPDFPTDAYESEEAAGAAAAAAAASASTASHSATSDAFGGVHGFVLFSALVVLPVTLDAALVLASCLEASWCEHAANVVEERFAHALAQACPRLIVAATTGAVVPLCGALAVHLLTPMRLAAPVVQLAVATSVAVLSAHALVLSVFWSGLVLELRGEVRILLHHNRRAPEVDAAISLHAGLRRNPHGLVLGALTLLVALVGALALEARLPTTIDVRASLPDLGQAARFHRLLSAADVAAAGGLLEQTLSRPVHIDLSLTGTHALDFVAPGVCDALLRVHTTLRHSPLVLSIASSWVEQFAALEGAIACEHLTSRAPP
jgi:hypothetical protein